MQYHTSIKDLAEVTQLMRDLSRLTDPEDAAELYANGLDKMNLVPNDQYISLSRRDLPKPQYRITRNSAWTTHPNPWLERDKLPLLSGGLLADILYSNQPAIIPNLQQKLSPTDPAFDQLKGMNLLIALPHFDNGESINFGILLTKSDENYPLDIVPLMVWQANLWGRATLNLLHRQKLLAAYQTLDQELRIVGEIQKSLLPRELPQIPNIDIAVHYETSQHAGGDYYDFFPLPENKWGIFVADVSGHGTPAAVLMAITHAIAHSRPGQPTPPAQLLNYLNCHLATRYTANSATFVTALYGILDPAARTFTFASAGHPAPRLFRNNIPVEIPLLPAFPLGISAEELYKEQTLRFLPHDKLLLYTDGITEAHDPANGGQNLFEHHGLDQAAAHAVPTAQSLITHILKEITTFTQSTPLTDDRTLLALLIR